MSRDLGDLLVGTILLLVAWVLLQGSGHGAEIIVGIARARCGFIPGEHTDAEGALLAASMRLAAAWTKERNG